MQRNHNRRGPKGLADILLPYGMIDDGILLQQDGSLVAGWSYQGPDLMSSVKEELEALSARLNSALKLGTGWMLQCDAIRSEAPGYPGVGAFPDAITRLVDDERRQQFMRGHAHYESEYFLTLTYLPPLAVEEKVRGWMFDGRNAPGPASQIMDRFKAKVEMFENVFGALFRVERLGRRTVTDEDGYIRIYDSLLEYYRRCIDGNNHPFALPDVPVYLNEVLACADFLGGTEPRIGRKHIGVLAIDGFPDISTPGMLRELDALRIEYRWNTRAILLDPEEARPLLDKIKKKWKSKVRGWFAQLFKDQEAPVNEYALDQQKDAEQAAAVAASGNVQFVHYSSNVVCLDEDPVKLRTAIREVMRVIQNLGFSCRLEDINAIEAWRGTIPGDGYSNVRRVIMHTLNLADLLPTTSVWAGLKENPSALMPKHSPPLLFAATGGATPFRLNLHVSDLGHTLVVGPSGTGKSTLLGLIGSQWFRYPAAQVFCFDKGYSMWMLTQAAGGTFYDLAGVGNTMGFCPLREIDSDADLAWAVNWLECLCVLSGSSLGPRERTALTEAVIQLRLSPTRTLTELQANVQDHRVREALNHYTLSGAMGVMLDREEDMLTDGSRFVTFETEHLLQMDAKGIIPVLLYLFRSIERRLDGSPTLIILDEAWAYLRHDLFRERLRDWLKTMRKKNAAVIMAVQQISDLSKSEIADLLFESPTKILMPNAEAKTANARLFYERAGLNERELDQLALAIPKKNYYVVSVLGKRMVDLGIAPASLSFVGINSQEERQQIKTLISERPDEWRAEWLRCRGLPDWAEYYEQLEEQCSGQSVTV